MINDFEEICFIGSGAFGRVSKVRRKSDGAIYAMKTLPITLLDDRDKISAWNEVKILSDLQNPYIIQYSESFLHENALYIIMEFCENGDLSKFVKQKAQPLEEEMIWNIFIQICLGIEHLHMKKIIHRDIKLENIFLKDDRNIRLGDLGISKVLSTTRGFAHTKIGTPYYISPELCNDKPYNYKNDIWAIGCALYELCTQKKPFTAKNEAALILKIVKGKYDPIKRNISKNLKGIVQSCLKLHPEKRPDIFQLLQLPAVKEKIAALNLELPADSILNMPSPKKLKPAAKINKSGSGIINLASKGNKANYEKPKTNNTTQKSFFTEQIIEKSENNISVIPQQVNFVENSIEEVKLNFNKANDKDSGKIFHSGDDPQDNKPLATYSDEDSNLDLNRKLSLESSDDSSLLVTQNLLQKQLEDFETKELEFNSAATLKKNEIINIIGEFKFDILYSCFSENYKSNTVIDEAQLQELIEDTIGDPRSEVIFEITTLITLENEKSYYKERIDYIKTRMI